MTKDLNIVERAARKIADRIPVLRSLFYKSYAPVVPVCVFCAEIVKIDLLPSRSLTRKPPAYVNDVNASAFENARCIELNRKPLYRLSNASVIGPAGLIQDKRSRAYVLEQAWGSPSIMQFQPEYCERVFRPPRKISGPAFLLAGISSSNIFHWFHDIVSMLYGVDSCLPAEAKFLVPGTLPKFALDSLDVFGIPPDRRISLERRHYLCDELFYSPYWGSASFDSPAVADWLVDTVFGHQYSGNVEKRPIYVSRQRSNGRRIHNATEVEDLIVRRLGCRELFLEELSLAEQVKAFSSASLVIGVHGAGLTGICFCEPGTPVVEIQGHPVTEELQYYSIADARQLTYAVATGQRVSAGHYSAITVDISDLEAALNAVL